MEGVRLHNDNLSSPDPFTSWHREAFLMHPISEHAAWPMALLVRSGDSNASNLWEYQGFELSFRVFPPAAISSGNH